MPDFIREENDIPVKGSYDVIVVGGGIAGVSAALAARRLGCSVLLLEKSVILGGLATLGLIPYYEPMCDGFGRKIIGGMAEELLLLSIKYGFNTLSDEWKKGTDGNPAPKRYATFFSPSLFTLALDEIIVKEGVDLLLDTVFSKSIMENGWCRGIIVENKSGRECYTGKMVVDASGDVDVLFRSGAECVEADNWLTFCAYRSDLAGMKKAVELGNIRHGIKYNVWGADRLGRRQIPGSRKYGGTDAREVTAFVLDSRKLALQDFRDGSVDERELLMLPGMAQLRTTRRIRGIYELTEADSQKHFEDSIGCVCDFSKAGPIYEISYRCLISKGIDNIITAGRTIASSGHAWEVTRVIPPAALTGQAAGVAAALAARKAESLHRVQVTDIQSILEQTGVMIHY